MTPRYDVRIINPLTGRPKVWNSYPDRAAAEIEAAKLRAHKMYADVRRVDVDAPEAPEHGNERRRFLVWAVLAGFAQPERITEAIVAELEQEAAL